MTTKHSPALILGLILALSTAPACNRPITPADGAATTKDALTLANDVHKAVFDGYVAGAIPGPQADPIMNAVEQGLIPAARKTVAALRAWQAATTTDLKKIKAGDLTAALDLLQGSLTTVLGFSLPAGVADNVKGTAASIRNIIDTLRKAIADARADGATPADALAPAA